MRITSPQNPRIKRLRKLQERRHRRQLGATLVEGRRFVEEALAAGRPVRQAIYTAAFAAAPAGAALLRALAAAGTELAEVTDRLLEAVAMTETPQGIVAEVAVDEPAPVGPAWWRQVAEGRLPLALLPDGVQDPGNLGTLVRAAAGLGAAGAVLVPGTVDPFHPRAVRASAGACLRLPMARADSAAGAAESARAAGLAVWVAEAEAATPCWAVDWRRPCLLVVGNEGAGVSPEVQRYATGRVAIPLAGGIGSLNVAMAGCILLYEAARQAATAP
ncbi:tRNA/rRNA methyltransferase (SpoU) [Thermaerobacter marianensis DSM 12885]|uniref:tRNA/rRNA methyltransferase (SpoU) n=1 Tax=Thermaerobacter marianensis (strain ATCC 700841 / DSM 12885 / JCM 10246 / 7p75a) TaxID=644966 RepID=E6SIV1_THEM7|nr:RNA methyltransferase [Thermaerobacter marianensis]ADU50946.1 tRNA/rRNA methyltransferase (SpoU) [Thermaerobacter marianensis DSM 12885]